MAWTAPKTWVAGETVTSSMMNTHVRDNLNYLKSEVDNIAGMLDVSTSETWNSGSAETPIFTFSVPANTLVEDGDTLRAILWGDMVTSNTKTLKLYFGSTSVQLISGIYAYEWMVTAYVIKTGTGTQHFMPAVTSGGTPGSLGGMAWASPTEDETSAVDLKATGQGTASNQISVRGAIVEKLTAP